MLKPCLFHQWWKSIAKIQRNIEDNSKLLNKEKFDSEPVFNNQYLMTKITSLITE